MLVGEVGGDGSAAHPWVSSAFQGSFLCWGGRNVSVCVHVQVHAWVCEREAPGYLGPSAHVRVFCGQTRPGSLWISQTYTYTINVLLPLWKSELSAPWQANVAIWLANLQWCRCQSALTVVPLVVWVKWLCFSQTRKGGDRKKMTGTICGSIWVIACDVCMGLCVFVYVRMCVWRRVRPEVTLCSCSSF